MAALQSIRGKAGLLVTVLGVALLAFILSDVFTSGNAFFNKHKDNAFSVDGDVVSTGAYSDRINQMESFTKLMTNRSSLDESTTSGIRDEVYHQMVKEMALDNQADALGLSVTAEELEDMVYGANISPVILRFPLFVNPETRQFDRSYLTNFLQSIGQDASQMPDEMKQELQMGKDIWLMLENQMKYQRLEEKYASLVASTVLVNDLEVKAYADDSKTSANIAYVLNRYSTISDSTLTVSDNEIKELYNKRKSNFKLDAELRKISYFIKDVIPSEGDYTAVEQEMEAGAEKLRTSENIAQVVNDFPGNQFVDAYIAVSALPLDAKSFVERASTGEVYGPIRNNQNYVMYKLVDRTVGADSIKLQMIALPQELDFKTTEAVADSLLLAIKAGKNFGDIAEEYMPGSNGGEFPMMDEMTLVSSGVAKECIEAAKGTVLKTKIMGQTRLIRIMDKSAPVSKVKLAAISMPVIVSDKTQMSIDNELSQFVNESGNVEDFNTAAQNQGYSLVSNTIIRPELRGLGDVSSTRPVIHWAFAEKIGSVKKFDTQDKRIVAIVTGVIDTEYLPLEEVKESLEAELLRDKKAEKMIADLKVKSLASLDAYAQNIDSRVDTAKFVSFSTNDVSLVGYEPIFNVYAKAGQLNKVQGPVKGEAGVYVLDVSDRTTNPSVTDEKQTKQRLEQMNFYQLISGAVSVLNDKLNVKDNRVNFW